MFMHVWLQLMYSHAWTCTLFGLGWSTRPYFLSVANQVAILWIIITWLIDGWLRPYLSLLGWLRPYLFIIMVSSAGWLRPYHRPFSYVFWMVAPMPRLRVIEISVVHTCRFFLVVFQFNEFCKAFHPSHSLGLHALGGICYTAICHCHPVSIPSVSWNQIHHAHAL